LEHEDATDPNSTDQEPDPMAAAEKNHTNSMVIPGPGEVPTRRSMYFYLFFRDEFQGISPGITEAA